MSSTIIVRIFRIFEELIKVILKVKTELFIFFSKSSTILSVHQFSPMPSKDSLRGLYRNTKLKKNKVLDIHHHVWAIRRLPHFYFIF